MDLRIDFDALEAQASLREWSLRNRLLRGQPFSILPPLNALYDDNSKEVFVEKAAQVTISEYLINLALYGADSGWGGRGNVLYIFPATPQISDFSNARIEPVILESPYLRSSRQDIRNRTGRAEVNNIQLKQLRRGYIYLRGSNSRHQLISVDADIVIFDELDEMEEGTIEAGKKRTGSAKYPFYRGASTPKYPKRGIDAQLERSDKKVWMVKCERCGHQQDLAILQDLLFETPKSKKKLGILQVDPSDKGTYCHIGTRYYIGCHKCQHVLNVWNGEWVPTYTDNPAYGGYHIPKLISDHLDFDDLAKRAEDERLGKLTEIQIQEFYNSDLGIPRAPQGFQLQFPEIYACAEDAPEEYVLKSNDWFSWLDDYKIDLSYIGIDVAVRRMHLACIAFPVHNESLRKISPNNKPVLLFAGSVAPSASNTGFRELDPFLTKWSAMRCVIDRMPEFKNAAEFRSRHPGVVYTCGYGNWKNKPNYIYDFKYEKGTVEAGRTETLDVVYDAIRQRQILLPRNVAVIGGNINKRGFGEFCQHLMNNVRIVDMETQEAKYDEGAMPDHIAHALNYAFIAAQYNPLNTNEIKDWMVPGSIGDGVNTLSQSSYMKGLPFMNFGVTSRGNNGRNRQRADSSGFIVGTGFGGSGPGYGGY